MAYPKTVHQRSRTRETGQNCGIVASGGWTEVGGAEVHEVSKRSLGSYHCEYTNEELKKSRVDWSL